MLLLQLKQTSTILMDRKEAPKTLINRLEQEHYRHSILSIGIIVSFHNYLKRMAIVLFISFALHKSQLKQVNIVASQTHYNNASQNLLADCINSTQTINGDR